MTCDYTKLYEKMPSLGKYSRQLERRCQHFEAAYTDIINSYGSLFDFAVPADNFVRNQENYRFINPVPAKPPFPLHIYECCMECIGAPTPEKSYEYITQKILPQIRVLGYNTVLLTGISIKGSFAERRSHCFGFFAPSSHFGEHNMLKKLVDVAHRLGLYVVAELSYVIENTPAEFQAHPLQAVPQNEKKTPLAPPENSKTKILQELLCSMCCLVEDFFFDGFCFNGLSTMLFPNTLPPVGFGGLEQYFNDNLSLDAAAYLMLANTFCKEINPRCLLIAADSCEIPAICEPVRNGGFGFDYHIKADMPGFWHVFASNKRQISMAALWREICGKQHNHGSINCCECSKKAINGEESLLPRIMQSLEDICGGCLDNTPPANKPCKKTRQGIMCNNLHKMIRLLSCSCSSAYKNLMGTERGMPLSSNIPKHNIEYLADNIEFERKMLLICKNCAQQQKPPRLLLLDEQKRMLCFEKAGYVFVFNFDFFCSHSFMLPLKEGICWRKAMSCGANSLGLVNGTRQNVNLRQCSAAVFFAVSKKAKPR